MCWRTYYGMLSVPRTATKDISVKKAFTRYTGDDSRYDLRSLFRKSFRWSIGKKYVSRFFDKPKRLIGKRYSQRYYVWEVCCGFHSAKEMETKWDQDKEIGYIFLGKNLMASFSMYNRLFLENCVVIHDCIIPKGSKYYVNEYGEYVSDQLIVLPNQ